MEASALIERGFIKNEWEDEGEKFVEYELNMDKSSILISGISLVEIVIDGSWITVPNCNTIKDLDDLIRLFK